MGAFTDFLKQRERFAMSCPDSQTGTATSCGRPGMPADAPGRAESGVLTDSRDSQGVSCPARMIEPDTRSHQGIESHGLAENRADSQTHAEIRAALMAVAHAEGIPQHLVDAIDPRDLGACAGLPASTRNAYLRVLYRSRHMAAGHVPAGWTQVVQCVGCGPVWLPITMPAAVRACPWCRHRRAGCSVPMATG